nr:hypothetical protein Iba_chr07dCG11940 [Ipomoea batatas]
MFYVIVFPLDWLTFLNRIRRFNSTPIKQAITPRLDSCFIAILLVMVEDGILLCNQVLVFFFQKYLTVFQHSLLYVSFLWTKGNCFRSRLASM